MDTKGFKSHSGGILDLFITRANLPSPGLHFHAPSISDHSLIEGLPIQPETMFGTFRTHSWRKFDKDAFKLDLNNSERFLLTMLSHKTRGFNPGTIFLVRIIFDDLSTFCPDLFNSKWTDDEYLCSFYSLPCYLIFWWISFHIPGIGVVSMIIEHLCCCCDGCFQSTCCNSFWSS